jgi:hypothetical protein
MAYITVADAKDYIGGLSDPSDDALLSGIIDQAEQFIETYTGRDFKVAADTTRTLDAVNDVTGRTLYLDADLCSITTVTTNADAAGGGTALTENTDFITLPRNMTPYYALKMLTSSTNTWTFTDDPELGITIAGRWGYSTTPPADILQACKDLVKTIYRSRDSNTEAGNVILASGMVITPAQVPALTLSTLKAYRRIPTP